MADITHLAKKHQNLSEDDQKKAGQAIAGKMTKEHEDFLKLLITLLDEKQISSSDPQSFIKREVYDTMPQDWKGKVDVALRNIGDQIRHIEEFFRSKKTPNESPQLQTMISHLWQMKQRIEEKYDVFKF